MIKYKGKYCPITQFFCIRNHVSREGGGGNCGLCVIQSPILFCGFGVYCGAMGIVVWEGAPKSGMNLSTTKSR